MEITQELTDSAIMTELGQRISRRRLEFELTQAELAHEAGIAKRTLERVEAGESTQLLTLIRILRVLDLLKSLDRFIPASQPGPIELMERQGKVRQRATGSRGRNRASPAAEPESGGDSGSTWTWGDES